MKTLAALTLASAAAFAQETWESRDDAASREADLRREEVAALHLLGDLKVARDQMTALAALADEAGRVRVIFLARRSPAEKDLSTALDKLKQERLRPCGRISEATQQKAVEAESRVVDIRRAYLRQLKELEKRLGPILSETQLRRAAAYQPSVAPPRRKADAKAQDEFSELESHVENLRNLPDAVYDRILDPLFTLVFDEHEPWKDMTDEERKAEGNRLRRLMDRARELGDLEFERRKGEIAWEIIEPPVKDASAPAADELTPAGRVLLNPRVGDLLRALLKADEEHDPTCRECAKEAKFRKPPRELSGPKPDFDELADWLELSRDQRGPARAAIGQAQVELLDLLSRKRDDGEIPLVQIFRIGVDGGDESDLLKILGARVPGGRETYFERAASFKLGLDARLKKILTPDQFRRYSGSGVDVFGVRVGDLRRYAR